MKTTLLTIGAAALLLTTPPSRAGIIVGPITNPANGHNYYLLTPNTWTASEAEAEDMGGTLAVVRNADEQKWIYSTFGNLGGADRSPWMGLHRIQPGGKFVWVDGTPLDYTHWYPGEPNNAGGDENCAHMRWDPAAPGTWNDLSGANRLNAVVEIPAKSSKPITERERALIGNWYESGRLDRPCHIAATKNTAFAINEANGAAGRIFFHKDGILFVDAWQVHGEIIQGRILWSNNTWWSHEPVDFGKGE